MPGQSTAAAGDERAPLGAELVLASSFRQGDEQPGLRGDLLAHAELVDQHQTSFDVPIGLGGVAGGVGEEGLDPLDPALHEPVAAPERVAARGLGRGRAATELARGQQTHRFDGANGPGAELVVMPLERAGRRLDERRDLCRVDGDPGQPATGEGEGVLRAGVGDGQLVAGLEAELDGLALALDRRARARARIRPAGRCHRRSRPAARSRSAPSPPLPRARRSPRSAAARPSGGPHDLDSGTTTAG